VKRLGFSNKVHVGVSKVGGTLLGETISLPKVKMVAKKGKKLVILSVWEP